MEDPPPSNRIQVTNKLHYIHVGPRASPTAPRFLSLGAIATAAEALEKARQLQTAVEPPKQIPYQTHQVYQAQRAAPPSPIPLGVTGSTPPREPAFRQSLCTTWTAV
eukprot:symbB.v1.2.008585.t1/scaffold523.1/size192511/7